MRSIIAGVVLAAGFLATPAYASGPVQPARIVESLDRGLVAVPGRSGGTFLSWRLLGTEYGGDVSFNVYKGGHKLNRKPIDESTNFTWYYYDAPPASG